MNPRSSMEEHHFRRLIDRFLVVRFRYYCAVIKRPIVVRGIQKMNPRSSMEERHFRRLLDRFPVVRSRYYCADTERESCSHSAKNEIASCRNAQNKMVKKDDLAKTSDEDPFWQKLRVAAEKKVGPAKARNFCRAFQSIHKQLVYKELSLEAARRFIDAERN